MLVIEIIPYLSILEKLTKPHREELDSWTNRPGINIYAQSQSSNDSQGCEAFEYTGQLKLL